MYHSRFGKASWFLFGGALLWSLWSFLLTLGNDATSVYFNGCDVCHILPISSVLAAMGIVCGGIGYYRSHIRRSLCSAGIVVNCMLLIVLLMIKFS